MNSFSFKQNKKLIMLVLAAVAVFAAVVFAFAVFTDHVNRTTTLHTASFDDEGYAIDVSAPDGYLTAGNAVEIVLEESNTKSKDISSQIAMIAAWDSPVPDSVPWDDITITLDGEAIAPSVNEDQSISFALPKKTLPSGESGTQSNLVVQLPSDLTATGDIKFSFEQIELRSGEWTCSYDKDKLNALNFEVSTAWNISKDQTTARSNTNRDVIARLASGTSDDDYTLKIIKNGSDTNTNYGQMMNWTAKDQTPWSDYSITELNLSEGITTIGSYAFAGETGITELSLPSTVNTIGVSAFQGSGLSGELILPATIKIIESLAFGNLPDVNTITFEHGSDESLTLPDNTSEGKGTSGAFYVSDYVKTTLNLNENPAAKAYNWVADHRMKVGISEVTVSYDAIKSGETAEPVLTINPSNYDEPQSTKYTVIEGSDCLSVDSTTGVVTGLSGGSAKVQLTIVDANGETKTVTTTVLIIGSLGDAQIGNTVTLDVDGTPTEFIVVHQGNPDSTLYDTSCNGTWLLMKNIYEKRVWNSTSGTNIYADSTIHSYLNSAFLGLFDSDVQSAILQAKIPYVNGNGQGGSVASGSSGLSAKIFLLSGYEVGWTNSDNYYLYNDGICLDYFTGAADSDSKRVGYFESSTEMWWLRTPYADSSGVAFGVNHTGSYTGESCLESFGVRPALVLPSDVIVNDDGSISVDHLIVDSASVTTLPDKTEYTEGDTFDPTGMEVTITYKDGSTKTVSADDLTVENDSNLSAGQTEVTVSYTELGKTVEITVSITVKKTTSSVGDMEIGATVTLNVGGTPTEFIVVHQGNPDSSMYDASCNGTWLLMKDIYENREWHSSNSNSYKASTIHTYLNGTFLNLFDADIKAQIKTVKIPYVTSGSSVASGSSGLSTQIFLLAAYEVGFTSSSGSYIPVDGTCLSYFSEGASRKAYLNGVATAWWLRSPHSYYSSRTWYVSANSSIENNGCSNPFGIRPALIMPSNALVNSDGSLDVSELLKISAAPSQNGTLTYNGSVQSPTWSDYDSTKLTIGGTTSATNAGTYTATFTPVSGYTWSDGTTAAKEVTWTIQEAETVEIGSLAVGSSVYLNENGSPVEYLVVNQGIPSDSSLYDSSCDGTWLLRKKAHSEQIFDDSDNDYGNSKIHTYLNGTFMELFDSDTQNAIKQVKIPYQNGTGSGGSVKSGADGLSTKIFLLGVLELGWTRTSGDYHPIAGASLDYFNGMDFTDSGRICHTDYIDVDVEDTFDTEWWTRDPVTNGKSQIYCVMSDGGQTSSSYKSNLIGIRPAFIVPANTAVDFDGFIDGSLKTTTLAVPSQAEELTYTGESQSPEWISYHHSTMTIGGTVSATDAGTYEATFTPKAGYIWPDGTTETKTANWTIGQADGKVTLSATSGTLTIPLEGEVTVENLSGASLNAISSDENVATAAVSGSTVSITPVGEGTATITVTSPSTKNYKEASATYTVTVELAGIPLGDMEIGDIVTMNVDGTATEFIVVHQGNPNSTLYDASCDGTWLLMKDVYESRQLNSSSQNSYSDSTIHTYLNGTFLGLFDTGIQNQIKTVKLPYFKGLGTSGSVASGVNGLSTKIFLLGGYEVGFKTNTSQGITIAQDGAKLSYFPSNSSVYSDAIAYLNGTATTWWLRTPFHNINSFNWSIDNTGQLSGNNVKTAYGIRPALIMPSDAMVRLDNSVAP